MRYRPHRILAIFSLSLLVLLLVDTYGLKRDIATEIFIEGIVEESPSSRDDNVWYLKVYTASGNTYLLRNIPESYFNNQDTLFSIRTSLLRSNLFISLPTASGYSQIDIGFIYGNPVMLLFIIALSIMAALDSLNIHVFKNKWSGEMFIYAYSFITIVLFVFHITNTFSS